jgi:hypothetical protein
MCQRVAFAIHNNLNAHCMLDAIRTFETHLSHFDIVDLAEVNSTQNNAYLNP